MSSATYHDQPHGDHRQCSCSSASTPATQSLDELEFERGIWTAAIDNDAAKVRTLIARGHLVDRDNSGYTALHYAARAGHLEVCRILLEAGIGVNERTHRGGATALHRAAMMGRDQIIKLLLAHKADALLQDSDGKTALHRAAEKGHLESCRILLQAGPAARSLPDSKGHIPVEAISPSSPQYEQLKDLLERSA